MRWLVAGGEGMLARDLVALLRQRGAAVAAPARTAMDITDREAVAKAFTRCDPDIVVNCAAYTAVDDAEDDEESAHLLNGYGPGVLAAECAARRIRLIHLSTDYVFAGDASTPYGEHDPTAPRTAYGRTKLTGERAVIDTLGDDAVVLRTAWLYGRHGRSFVATMLRLAAGDGPVDVVDDQHGQPTWTVDVAERIADVGDRPDLSGVYHATSSGATSWYELARAIFELAGADPRRVRPTTSAAYVRPAPRPGFSVLGHDRWATAGLSPLRHWRAGLRDALAPGGPHSLT
jgi:dTDP-4-dehydrorhamnose reductase